MRPISEMEIDPAGANEALLHHRVWRCGTGDPRTCTRSDVGSMFRSPVGFSWSLVFCQVWTDVLSDLGCVI